MQLVETAYRWIQHTRTTGCRFDLERKAAQSVAFILDRGGHSFALPSKLEGVSRHQDVLSAIQSTGAPYQRLDLNVEEGRIVASWHGVQVGFIRPKHVRWLRPLLTTGRIRCFVLQVTDSGHRYRGCNVVLAGIGAALDALSALPQPRDEKGRFLPKATAVAVRESALAYHAVA